MAGTRRFLTEEVPVLVAATVRDELSRTIDEWGGEPSGEASRSHGPAGPGDASGTEEMGCEVVRSRLKPHRKLSVYLSLTIGGPDPGRPR
nr:hypothetical protein DA06_15095 [Georgenia sp. SUBG003]